MSLRCTLLINMLVVDKLYGFTVVPVVVRLVGCNFSCNSHCCLMLLLLYIDKTKKQHSGNSRILSHDLVNLTAASESPRHDLVNLTAASESPRHDLVNLTAAGESSSTGISRRSVLHKTHGRSWETNLSLSSLPAHSWITQFF